MIPDRIIAIGDIHGCSIALRTLLAEINPQPSDQIVTLGDYIDRGPDSRGVLDQLIALADRCDLVPLLGNHEEMLFAAREQRSELHYWLKFGGEEMLQSYGPNADFDAIPSSHWRFLKSCRRFFESPTHLFVHANYWPNLPLDQLSTNTLLWEPLEIEKVWRHYSGKPVVLGHTPQKNGEVLDIGFLQCIDTYCHGGGWLTALEVATGDVIQANQRGNVRPGRLGAKFRPPSLD